MQNIPKDHSWQTAVVSRGKDSFFQLMLKLRQILACFTVMFLKLGSSECVFSDIYESIVTLLCEKRILQRSGDRFS